MKKKVKVIKAGSFSTVSAVETKIKLIEKERGDKK